MKGIFSGCLIFALCLVAAVRGDSDESGSGSGSGGYAEFCESATTYAEVASYCSWPVKYQLYLYMLYGSNVYQNEDVDSLEGFSGWGSGSGISGGSSEESSYESSDESSEESGTPWYASGSGSGWHAEDLDICGASMDWFEECMDIFDVCGDDSDLVMELDGYIDNYRNAFCDGDQLHSDFDQFDGSLTEELLTTLESGLACTSFSEMSELFLDGTCDIDYDDFEAYEDDGIYEVEDALESAFRSSFACIRSVLTEENDCSLSELDELETLVFFRYSQTLIPGLDVPFDEIFAGFDVSEQDPNEETRSTVAVYGDPHILAFGAADSVACAAPGRQSYLRNTYVRIMGNNTIATDENGDDSEHSATYMTSVDITIYDSEGTMVAEYSAGDSDLPGSFTSNQGGATIDVRSSTYVIISSETGGVAIALNRYEHTFQMVVRMADSVFTASSGLLYSGCPAADVIDASAIIAAADSSRRRRSTGCASDQCQFDLISTGDIDLAEGGTNAYETMVEDAVELDAVLVITDDSDEDSVAAVRPTVALVALLGAACLALLH